MAAYIHLLKRDDEGKAFLKIMRSFEQTKKFTTACYSSWQNPAYPVQLVWSDKGPFLTYKEKGKEFDEAWSGVTGTKVESKHFLREEAYQIISEKVKDLLVIYLKAL